ncbi:PAS domain-containing protein [Rhodanobacter sp. FDAARGOS 1247]|uniref:sensor histidine kinase n=1 Tax=Rhodanobacter sp. FDAARGOS 1247 TaxID=2778082 RepID=UPI00194E980E|nr:ATP-binding protein [Rhodanobacter sp. FDAARGOS 1247]QRP64532.1 PAS domain-containing protein [Rhodanobacter sp. FDAARGOS 1247]
MPAFERRVLSGGWLVALPALAALAIVLLTGRPEVELCWLLAVAVLVLTAMLARWQHRRVVYPLYTLVGLLEALREGDYSLRGVSGGALGEAIYDINALADRLQRERLQSEDSARLLGKTLASLDSAVFVFDSDVRLRLLNPAAQRLLTGERHALMGRRADELGLDALLAAPSAQVVRHVFPGRSGRFEIRHAPLRNEGRNGQLLVVNDVGRALREEERQAWQRLLRVLGHEVNNSLASIHSLAGTLASLVAREPLPDDWREDARGGLQVIGNRAESLARFLAGYSKLAALPPPQKRSVDLAERIAAVARLEQRLAVRVEDGPPLSLQADPDQLEQALINLLRNAVEASLNGKGEVVMRWRSEGERVLIEILDDGPGLPGSDNLFVPFFTTKPGGSGIGLALVRQIAEAHEGGVSLGAREGAPGAVAQLWLPLELARD